MIRIQGRLINEREILFIEKYGFFEIHVHFRNNGKLEFTYGDTEIRDAAFASIDQYGRD